MLSKRIQKHLIDRDDTLYYNNALARFYIDTYNDGKGGIVFKLAAFSFSKDECGDYGQRVETRIIDTTDELQRTMRELSGTISRWRVLRNGN